MTHFVGRENDQCRQAANHRFEMNRTGISNFNNVLIGADSKIMDRRVMAINNSNEKQ